MVRVLKKSATKPAIFITSLRSIIVTASHPPVPLSTAERKSGSTAIARHLERLREDVPVFTIGLIHDEDEIQTASRACDWRPRWLPRGEPSTDDASLVLAMLSTLELPEGDGYVWIAGESGTTKAIRSALIERGHPREWLYASGYWKQGVSDVHDKFE